MKRGLVIVLLIGIFLLAGCNLPSNDAADGLDPTSAAIVEMTVEAAQRTAAGGDGSGSTTQDASGEDQTPQATAQTTPAVTGTAEDGEDDGEHGTDQARFISDVTIPDYAAVDPGEEIVKTWRLQNVGTATWTTEYALVFDDEDQMGAPDRVPLTVEVPPDGYINISVNFTAPETAGEYSSYWLLENDNGDTFGTGGEYDEPIWMIIVVSGDDVQTGSSDQGIAGGALITDAAVTASSVNYSGSCPAQITFTYTVTTGSEGLVNYHLIFSAISPSNWVFDDPGIGSISVGGVATLTYTYLFLPPSSVTGTARVQAVGSNTFVSTPLQFSVNCN